MIRAAICDDELMMLERMQSVINETFEKQQFQCEVFGFQSGEKLLEAHQTHPFDILFLDILMPKRNGFDIAKDVRQISDKTLLLFVTSQDELVYDSFDYHPFYFLRKGDRRTFANSLSDAVKKIITYIKRNEMISLELGAGEYKMISLQDILYLKSNAHFVDYYLVSGEVVHVRELINDAEKRLDEYGFARAHRQYIVNIYKVQKLNTSRYPEILLRNGQTLPLGRKYRDAVTLKYTEHMRNIL